MKTTRFSFLVACVASAFVTVGTAVTISQHAGAAATNQVRLGPLTGTSSDPFTMTILGGDEFCPGDGVAGYRWSPYIISASASPTDDILWNGALDGFPNEVDAFLLTDDSGAFIRNRQPGLGDGYVNLTPPLAFTFDSNLGGILTPGDWRIGVVCTLPNSSNVRETVKYWEDTITITSSAGAGTHDFVWEQQDPGSGTSTTDPDDTTTTTDPDDTTTTTDPDGTTTTTVAGGTTTSSVASQSGNINSGGNTGVGSGSNTRSNSQGSLATTGSSSWWIVLLAIAALYLGRLAILSARKVQVLPPGHG